MTHRYPYDDADLLGRAADGERVLLLLPSMEMAGLALNCLAETAGDDGTWRVTRTNGPYRLDHQRSHGLLRIHTTAVPSVARGFALDHARAYCPDAHREPVAMSVYPALNASGGQLELRPVI